MKGNHWTLLLTTVATLLSGAVAVRSYRALNDESAEAASVASVGPGKSTYIIRDSNVPGRCIGEGHLLLESADSQVSLTIDGWALLGVNQASAPVSLRGTASFNSLGQLTAMVFYTGIKDAKFKFGSTQINPIKFEVYRDTPESPLLFRQLLPGPVTLKPKGDVFELSVPYLSQFKEHHAGVPAPLILEKTDAAIACDVATAGTLDLSPLLRTADSVARIIQNNFGGHE